MAGFRSRSYCAIVVALVKPLGWYMTRVFNGERTFLSPILRPVEVGLYRLGGVDETREQHWLDLRGRHAALPCRRLPHPLCAAAPARLPAVQPAGHGGCARALAFNTAVSFITNTNWQNYGGESTLSYLVQMLGPDASELPLGGDRHRARRRADPRLRARLGARRSAISGSISPAARSTSCCRSASCLRCSSSGRACRRRSAPMSTRRRSKAPSRRSR